MKKIEAIIRKERFEQVDAALKAIGVGGLTLEEVKGRGRTRLVTTVYSRGVFTHEEEYIKHFKIEILVKDEDAPKVVDAIMTSASTGAAGDGKVFVTSVEEVLDIGSRQSGKRAVEIEDMPPVTVYNSVPGKN
ncbi:MAG: P-II family nitrogen regulator [Thaumarchaeota archaeon]|nr:P-II family nitrogen regulator [Nitrososphaerota archaeon]